jgi:hypothetical protein
MLTDPNLTNWVIAWACVAGFVLYRHWRHGWGVGLLITYIFSFAALHWLAPLLHLLPWFEPIRGDLTGEGLRQSTLALVGFAIGVELINARWRRDGESEPVESANRAAQERLIKLYLSAGVVLYVAALMGGRLPLIAAVVSTGSTLVAVSVGLKCWNAWRFERYGRMWLWLALTAIFPLLTVLTQGFLGFGFVAVLIVVSFLASFQRLRLRTVVGCLVLIYGGLSIYVTYMRDRTDIRELVWAGRGMEMRLTQLETTFREAEGFDPWNIEHLGRVEKRLNQNHLVGSAVLYLREGNARFAQGSTLVDAIVALVPRAIWPNKPIVGGSGDIVSNYTGMRFAFGTSVGVGQVMELYVNFGATGVVLGFIIIGALVARIDRRAAWNLAEGNIGRFAVWYMPGLSLLQIGGSIAEVTATAAASWVLMIIVNKLGQPVSPGAVERVPARPLPAVDRKGEVVS